MNWPSEDEHWRRVPSIKRKDWPSIIDTTVCLFLIGTAWMIGGYIVYWMTGSDAAESRIILALALLGFSALTAVSATASVFIFRAETAERKTLAFALGFLALATVILILPWI